MDNAELGAVVRRCKGLYVGLAVSSLAGAALGVAGVVVHPIISEAFSAVLCVLVFVLARVYTPPAILFIIPCSCVLVFLGVFDLILLTIIFTGGSTEAYALTYLVSMGMSGAQAVVGAALLSLTLATRAALMRVRIRVVHNAPLPGRAVRLIKCRAAEDCPAATAEGKEVVMVDNHVGLPRASVRLDALEFPPRPRDPRGGQWGGQRAGGAGRAEDGNVAAQELLARVMGAFPGSAICAADIKEEMPAARGKEGRGAARKGDPGAGGGPGPGAGPRGPPAARDAPDSRDFHLDYVRDRRKGPVADGGPVVVASAAARPQPARGPPNPGQRRGAHKYGEPEALSYSIAAKQELPVGSDYQLGA